MVVLSKLRRRRCWGQKLASAAKARKDYDEERRKSAKADEEKLEASMNSNDFNEDDQLLKIENTQWENLLEELRKQEEPVH